VTAFQGQFAAKRVLVTGHTGFKGSWLIVWLKQLGAEVYGYSTPPPTTPAMFEVCGLQNEIDHQISDVRDAKSLAARVAEVQPQIIFHLAAQPLVRLSYREPLETLQTNVNGVANLLEAVRASGQPCAVVIVTSDKCYANREWVWGYRESDPMGGHDPYSMSKGAAELVVDCWRSSYFGAPDSPVRVASARAGNVIGGGDWAVDRIMTDSLGALVAGQSIRMRNPNAIRPWQHVLEPLSGYLWLASRLLGEKGSLYASGWNFGPRVEDTRTVRELVDNLILRWGAGRSEAIGAEPALKEAMTLSLNCDKAHHELGWRPCWTFDSGMNATVDWYRAWHDGQHDMRAFTIRQIDDYVAAASTAGIAWTSVD
jgi:CDP-glucose 4,6-dehydratase